MQSTPAIGGGLFFWPWTRDERNYRIAIKQNKYENVRMLSLLSAISI